MGKATPQEVTRCLVCDAPLVPWEWQRDLCPTCQARGPHLNRLMFGQRTADDDPPTPTPGEDV